MALRITTVILLLVSLAACDKVNPVKVATHSTQGLADEIKAIVGYQPGVNATWSTSGKLESVNITLYGRSFGDTTSTPPAKIKEIIRKHLNQTPDTLILSYQFKADEL
nr:hypothetical protein [Pseudomonas chengduensis]